MNFSKRMGLEPAVKPFQTVEMDRDLRYSLWNAYELSILPTLKHQWAYNADYSRRGASGDLLVGLWVGFFKWPLNTLSERASFALEVVRNWFFDEARAPWNKVYDFVEFIGNLHGDIQMEVEGYRNICNTFLERECSAYRFIGSTIGPITSDAEIEAIEQAALMDNSLLRPVSNQIEKALKLLSDRQNPDYENSIKESISAVETLCCLIAGQNNTLGQALKVVKDKLGLHSALASGFSSLYGWTSEESGIRHGAKPGSLSCEFEDAKYMLVSCSAFVNYLVEKANKNGLLPK